jgi:LPXTG-motif cell wall-anchored protein
VKHHLIEWISSPTINAGVCQDRPLVRHVRSSWKAFHMAVATVARRVLATGAIAGTALLALTIPASAHTNGVSSDCTDNGSYLKVDLTNYNGGVTNTVQVTVDGQSQADEQFKSAWNKNWDLANTAEHSYTVTVKAGDDQDGSQGFSFTKSGKIAACVTPPPTTTTTTVAPTTTTTSETPVPTTSPAATPPADQGGLANTGASVGLPLGIGALLLVGGGALLLVVRKRRSAA